MVSRIAKNKKTTLYIVLIGIALSAIIFLLNLMIGPGNIYNPIDALNNLFSAISKGGKNLSVDEIFAYSRAPRAMAAFAVGIGLSIAGSVYQAIIKNPLVDPYIMGVSSGAGTFAVAVLTLNFTFFGLLQGNPYLVAISALIGGILAFFITMFIAEKSGGSSINYVLAGIVVGLAFSAIQTLVMTFGSGKVTSALTWLFGSFVNISWTNLPFVLIPAVLLSLVPFLWVKEFNLVLLGDDQAKQLGLDVKKFNRLMLILASVITAVCVAFVGIIGFVGLVIPHLCRLVFGGDHRFVFPASFLFGGAFLMLADLASRMIVPGLELPVGAITAIIGVPVFAWILIKKGRSYGG